VSPEQLIERRRRSWREYARRKRERVLAVRQRSAQRCQKGHGLGICGGPLETTVNRLGRAVLSCPWCDRQARGICRDCPRPIAGGRNALRCASCRDAAKRRQIAQYQIRHHDEIVKRHRQSQRDCTPEQRQAKLEYKRAWRKANRDKVAAQKRRAALRQPARVREYMAEYRDRHQADRATLRQLRSRGEIAGHGCTTPGCTVMLTGRRKLCEACTEAARREASAALASRKGRGRRSDLAGVGPSQ
jgi:hypothetical protein